MKKLNRVAADRQSGIGSFLRFHNSRAPLCDAEENERGEAATLCYARFNVEGVRFVSIDSDGPCDGVLGVVVIHEGYSFNESWSES